jgi:hypothetical protein
MMEFILMLLNDNRDISEIGLYENIESMKRYQLSLGNWRDKQFRGINRCCLK